MQFDVWTSEVKRIVAESGRDLKPDALDANAMYVAFANGVSPDVYATANAIVTAPPVERSMDRASAPPRLGAIEHDETHEAKKAEAGSSWVGFWLIVGFCVLAFMFPQCAAKPESAPSTAVNYNANPSSTVTPVPPPKPTPRPLTDKQKVDRAKLALATWTGDDEAYLSAVAILGQVPKTSKAHLEAIHVLGKWRDRKRRSDVHKVEAARVAAINAVKKEREEAKYLTGDGDVKVAVYDVKLRHSTDMHVANRNSTFVYVGIAVKNTGGDTVHVNPNDFTLADSDGNTSSHEADSYSLGNYFDAVNLTPGQQTSGWLIFCMRKDKRYTLTRNGMLDPSVQKAVIP